MFKKLYNESMNKGNPRRFLNGDELVNDMKRFLSECRHEEKMPSIAGFCVFCDITYSTFYEQRAYYSESFDKINVMLESEVLNNHSNGDAFRMFYMKNKFGYTDKIEQSIVTPEPIRIRNMEALDKDELLALKAITKKLEVKGSDD